MIGLCGRFWRGLDYGFFFGFFDLIVSLVRFDEFMGVLFKVLAFF